jgi:xanthine dehydrogenase accessory factor
LSDLTEVLLELAHGDERAVVFTTIEGPRPGSKLIVLLDRNETLGDGPIGLAELAPDIRRNGLVEHAGERVFAEVFGPPPRLVVVGAVDTSEALCAAAQAIGWRTICVDARTLFATAERIPSADQIIVAWPEEALAEVHPDRNTAVVVLTHDEKFDIPALTTALRTDAFYVGALGSRRAQEKRRERLRDAGLTEDELARLQGPCGLDIGAVTPAETALSILAEILAVSAGRPGGPLRIASGRIHVDRDALS